MLDNMCENLTNNPNKNKKIVLEKYSIYIHVRYLMCVREFSYLPPETDAYLDSWS